MSVLLITHELKTKDKDYEPFYNALKTNCSYWWHFLDVTWIVDTPLTAHQYANLLYPHITNEDRLLVVKITKEHQGWLPKDAWDWLASRIY
jgi:hypothetical protein